VSRLHDQFSGAKRLLALVGAISLVMVTRGLVVDPPAGLFELIAGIARRLMPTRLQGQAD
jgi:hypothetical protein